MPAASDAHTPVPGRSMGKLKSPLIQVTKVSVQRETVASVSSEASKPRMSSSATCVGSRAECLR